MQVLFGRSVVPVVGNCGDTHKGADAGDPTPEGHLMSKIALKTNVLWTIWAIGISVDFPERELSVFLGPWEFVIGPRS